MARNRNSPVTPDKPLTPMEAEFVRYYELDVYGPHWRNAFQAARAAGFSELNTSAGSKLMAKVNVAAAIDRIRAERLAMTKARSDEVVARVVLQSHGILPTKVERRAVVIDGKKLKDENGNTVFQETETYDTLAAAKLELQRTGQLVERHEHTGQIQVSPVILHDPDIAKFVTAEVQAKEIRRQKALPEGEQS
jgi:phage terminase small subunit